MSDASAPTTAASPAAPAIDGAVAFSEREVKLLVAAMTCLKSGPPDVDYSKLQKAGGFNTLKTTQNQWGSLKKKILSFNPPEEGAEGGESFSDVPRLHAIN